MKTVQLAIRDSEYAQSLRNSLLRDGTHRVYLVDQPDLRIDGVVVIDGSTLDNLAAYGEQAERFVVITRKGSDSLSRLWNAGIRHVRVRRRFSQHGPTGHHCGRIAFTQSRAQGRPGLWSTQRKTSHRSAARLAGARRSLALRKMQLYQLAQIQFQGILSNAYSFDSLGCTRCHGNHARHHEEGACPYAAGRHPSPGIGPGASVA